MRKDIKGALIFTLVLGMIVALFAMQSCDGKSDDQARYEITKRDPSSGMSLEMAGFRCPKADQMMLTWGPPDHLVNSPVCITFEVAIPR